MEGGVRVEECDHSKNKQTNRAVNKILKGRVHTLLPAIETTDAIGNTENKQVKRNMRKYFQRIFMLFSLSLGYLFYDTYSYLL